jgi:hypothetical protein
LKPAQTSAWHAIPLRQSTNANSGFAIDRFDQRVVEAVAVAAARKSVVIEVLLRQPPMRRANTPMKNARNRPALLRRATRRHFLDPKVRLQGVDPLGA